MFAVTPILTKKTPAPPPVQSPLPFSVQFPSTASAVAPGPVIVVPLPVVRVRVSVPPESVIVDGFDTLKVIAVLSWLFAYVTASRSEQAPAPLVAHAFVVSPVVVTVTVAAEAMTGRQSASTTKSSTAAPSTTPARTTRPIPVAIAPRPSS